VQSCIEQSRIPTAQRYLLWGQRVGMALLKQEKAVSAPLAQTVLSAQTVIWSRADTAAQIACQVAAALRMDSSLQLLPHAGCQMAGASASQAVAWRRAALNSSGTSVACSMITNARSGVKCLAPATSSVDGSFLVVSLQTMCRMELLAMALREFVNLAHAPCCHGCSLQLRQLCQSHVSHRTLG